MINRREFLGSTLALAVLPAPGIKQIVENKPVDPNAKYTYGKVYHTPDGYNVLRVEVFAKQACQIMITNNTLTNISKYYHYYERGGVGGTDKFTIAIGQSNNFYLTCIYSTAPIQYKLEWHTQQHYKGVNGVEEIKKIMQDHPKPIIVSENLGQW